MAGSDVVEAMQLALKPFHMQHLADDWAAQAGEKHVISLQLSVKPTRASGGARGPPEAPTTVRRAAVRKRQA